jgi:signal transduction histidine kinase
MEDHLERMKGGTGLAWGLAAVACAAIPAILLLNAGAGEYSQDRVAGVVGPVAILTSVAVGLVVALRRPSNPIGWLLLANGLIFGWLGGFPAAWAGYALEHPDTLPGGRLAAVWDTAAWPLLFAGVVAIAFVFPDGRLLSRRWRSIAIGGAVAAAVTMAGGLLSGNALDPPFEDVAPLELLPDSITGAMQGLGLLGMFAALIAAAVAVASRFRGSKGELRAQMKWVAYAAILIPVTIVVGTLDGGSGLATLLSIMALEIAIPLSIGIAVMRYRLYEIDRLISATLVYGTLTVLLAAAFVAVTLGGGVLIGGGAAVPTAAATLAVTLAFRPLRARVQTVVDRRFNRARYEGLQQVDRFLGDLRVGKAEPEGIGEVLAQAASDPSLRLFFWLPHDEAHADAAGRLVPELPASPAGRTPVRRGELQLGTVVHDPALRDRASLLDPVILRAGLAIEIARLRVEVRRQLSEVEQSRTRIVTATYEERRRLERDLHDGAQQRLVSLGLDLRHVQHELGEASGGDAKATLDSVVAGLAEAIEELRELARGVRPAALDDGLAAALSELAARAPIRTEVVATTERFDNEVETAAYFVASEALTNAVKHASGSQVVLRANRDNGNLVLSVSDDGRGGAAPGRGSGLTGLGDRVAALGGRLDLRSDSSGTAVVAEFPCES